MKNRSLLSVVLCSIALAISATALARPFPAVLSGAVTKLSGSGPVQVLLPKVIPSAISKCGIKRVYANRSKTGYTVTLYFATEASDATFAGMISGSTVTSSSLPGTSQVRLANGAIAQFRPVSCGGSCAPANLWWQVGGFEYQLQLKLSSGLRTDQQRRVLVEMANSMSRVH